MKWNRRGTDCVQVSEPVKVAGQGERFRIMAKSISLADALAVLRDSGIELGEEHSEAIAELEKAARMGAAVSIIGGDGEKFPGKLVDKPKFSAEEWADRIMEFSEDFANDFLGEVKPVQGGATRMVRVVGIDTPAGHFKLDLRSE
jgi:hypothetical protein